MRTKINYLRHISVLFLTILIFTVGIFIGSSIEQLRVESLYTNLQEQDLSYQNMVTENNYLEYILDNNYSCDVITKTYLNSIDNLDKSRIKLESYINSGKYSEEEFFRLKEHYSNIQINYWILANKITNLCNSNFETILFFYADKKECPSCEDQGIHLDYVKKKLGSEILIFSLDYQKDGANKLIAKNYNITLSDLPILIINDKSYFFSTNEEIFNLLNISN